MEVSVIIPAYNCHSTINTTLASLAMQQLDDGDSFHVVVVNDASTDGDYHDIVEYWSRLLDISEIDCEVNGGPGTARQVGMDNSDSDYVLFVDADDALEGEYAIRSLIRGAKDADIVMGIFIEDTDMGFVEHRENFTWFHGKMFKRRFLDRFLLRINGTRANEDVGFITLCSKLTDNIRFIPQTVYLWNNNKASTVRKDSLHYQCGEGWRGYIENLAWSAEQQMLRGINKGLTCQFVIDVVGRLYFQYCESLERLPEEAEQNLAKLREFYNRAMRPFVLDGAVTWEALRKSYFMAAQTDSFLSVPKLTYREFLWRLGYFEDMKSIYYAEEENENKLESPGEE